ncbi:MAG: hypothetical protein Q9174_004430 [Haloplaca sp. 1 TL-2023]
MKLQPANNLVSLDVTISNTQIQAVNSLRSLLATSKDLRNLSVNVLKAPHPVLDDIALCVPGFPLPPLKVLKIQGAKLADYTTPEWQQCMDWTALTHLECIDLDFVPALSTLLKELVTLKVSYNIMSHSDTTELLWELTESLPKLEHLDVADQSNWPTWRDYPKPPPTLSTYNFHGTCTTSRSRSWGHLALSDIGDMGRFFTRLETAGFDIFIENSRVPWRLLETIADSFMSIVHLELFLWVSDAEVTTFQKTLRVRQGAVYPDRTGWGLIGFDPPQVTFEARLSEQDDLADMGVANVVCLELEGLLEKYGKGSLVNDQQRALRDDMTSRAERGSTLKQGLPTDVLGNQWPHIRPLRTTLVALNEGQLC